MLIICRVRRCYIDDQFATLRQVIFGPKVSSCNKMSSSRDGEDSFSNDKADEHVESTRSKESTSAADSQTRSVATGATQRHERDDNNTDAEDIENEENLHERMHKQKRHQHRNNHHHHHHHHHHNNYPHDKALSSGHVKELIKPDRTVRVARSPVDSVAPKSSSQRAPVPRVATVVGEEQLHQRLIESKSLRRIATGRSPSETADKGSGRQVSASLKQQPQPQNSRSASASSSSSSGSSSSTSRGAHDGVRSPPPAAIIIPPSVAKSLSYRAGSSSGAGASGQSSVLAGAASSRSSPAIGAGISREQLEYGPLLRNDEVQVLYRSPDANSDSLSAFSPLSIFLNPQRP